MFYCIAKCLHSEAHKQRKLVKQKRFLEFPVLVLVCGENLLTEMGNETR